MNIRIDFMVEVDTSYKLLKAISILLKKKSMVFGSN